MTDIARPRSLASLRDSHDRWCGIYAGTLSPNALEIALNLARQIAEHPDNEKEA